jgi:hypothetical protein
MLVEKLKGARERKRRATGKKVGGRQNYAEIDGGLKLIALAKKLHRYPVNGRQRTLADVAGALAEAGYLSSAGTNYTPTAVSRMLASTEAKSASTRKGEAKSLSSTLVPVAAELKDDTTEAADPVMRTPLGAGRNEGNDCAGGGRPRSSPDGGKSKNLQAPQS